MGGGKEEKEDGGGFEVMRVRDNEVGRDERRDCLFYEDDRRERG